MKKLVVDAQNIPKTLGTHRRILTEDELRKQVDLRSIVTNGFIAKGEVIGHAFFSG